MNASSTHHERIMNGTIDYIHSLYIKDLYRDLLQKKCGTTTIKSLTNRICRRLPQRRKDRLNGIVMKWTLEEAESRSTKSAKENTKTWRDNQRILSNARVIREFKEIWKKERKRYKDSLQKKRRKKVKHLVSKYQKKRVVPDEIDGVIIKEQIIPDNFSTEPIIHGEAPINEKEKLILSLPPKFAL